MKHIFIANDNHSRKINDKLLFVENISRERKYDHIIERTVSAKHAVALAKHYSNLASAEDPVRIYAVGGDGTANEVVNGICSSENPGLTEMAVIPAGTGNDFVRGLLGNDMSENRIQQYISNLFTSPSHLIDTARINDGYFLNISSIGIDAVTNYNLHKFTKKFTFINTKLAYVAAALSTFTKSCNMALHITVDGQETFYKDVILAAIANGYYYGGGICPCPASRLSDGFLDICLIDAVTRPRILTLIPSFLKSAHTVLPEVNMIRAKKIRFDAGKEMILNIDGEIIQSDHLDIEIVEKSLRLVSPPWALKNL